MHRHHPTQVPLRMAAAVLGGYAFTWGFSALGIAALVALGADFEDAEAGTLLLALLVFLGVFLWAFAARRIALVWLVLAGGGALMTAAAWALQRLIV
ncbi:iron uptake protein [Hydrogenophaga taeniospiralis]|jgi:hypothetical protein|uniref:iron uptake protein n=1 Tax=Hydrogenophaga taeniospiralis TaxID=65656 RepID=UPI001CFA432A|nr:iron uptake protein [Hydrogenophaga taeniospiralis]MCB4362641.1 iron uptake protein [Hydrogenophaga taeniospiralis]